MKTKVHREWREICNSFGVHWSSKLMSSIWGNKGRRREAELEEWIQWNWRKCHKKCSGYCVWSNQNKAKSFPKCCSSEKLEVFLTGSISNINEPASQASTEIVKGKENNWKANNLALFVWWLVQSFLLFRFFVLASSSFIKFHFLPAAAVATACQCLGVSILW